MKKKYIEKVFAEKTEGRTDYLERHGQLKDQKNYREAEQPVDFRYMQ
jgi:hypothetical protein